MMALLTAGLDNFESMMNMHTVPLEVLAAEGTLLTAGTPEHHRFLRHTTNYSKGLVRSVAHPVIICQVSEVVVLCRLLEPQRLRALLSTTDSCASLPEIAGPCKIRKSPSEYLSSLRGCCVVQAVGAAAPEGTLLTAGTSEQHRFLRRSASSSRALEGNWIAY